MIILIKRYLGAVLLILLMFNLSGCQSNDYSSNFNKFINNDTSKATINLPSGYYIRASSLKKEKEGKHVVLSCSLDVDACVRLGKLKADLWGTLPIEDLKNDLKSACELVVNYAKDNKWENNYYLFAEIDTYCSCYGNFIYDYEKDTLFVPKFHKYCLEMNDKFGTLSTLNIEKTDEGKEWLISNGLATLKHDELDYSDIRHKYYSINILDDGRFKEYDKGNCDEY